MQPGGDMAGTGGMPMPPGKAATRTLCSKSFMTPGAFFPAFSMVAPHSLQKAFFPKEWYVRCPWILFLPRKWGAPVGDGIWSASLNDGPEVPRHDF